MPRVRYGPGLLFVLFGACALPPRVDDQRSPIGAYETFRGALARGEHEREYACLSDPLRGRLGLRSRHDWADARVIFLKQDHLVVKAIANSEPVGEPEIEPDGRARMRLRLKVFVFGKDATLWLRPVPLVRVWVEGDDHPILDRILPEFVLMRDVQSGKLGVHCPPDVAAALELGPGEKPDRFEAGRFWFLDEWEIGGRSSKEAKKELEQQE